jgi:transcription elongation factor GreA
MMVHQNSTTLTTFGVEKLRNKFDLLQERYTNITHDLKDKAQSQNILAIKRIEKEIILSDMIKLEAILAHATILEKETAPLRAEQGTKVVYLQQDTGKEHAVTLVDPLEADPLEGFISIQSPVGSMLLGRQSGESIAVATAKGNLCLTVTNLE